MSRTVFITGASSGIGEAFSFGTTALATAPLLMIGWGDGGAAALLAIPTFVAANIVVAVLILGTVRLVVQGRLLPRPVPAAVLRLAGPPRETAPSMLPPLP